MKTQLPDSLPLKSLTTLEADCIGRPSDIFASEASGGSIVLIGCSDLSSEPFEIAHLNQDLQVIQTLAGAVPSHCDGQSSITSTLWYALSHSDVRHLILCGHTRCRVLNHFLEAKKHGESPPSLARFDPLAIQLQTRGVPLDSQSIERIAAQENVLLQMKNLLTHSFLVDRLSDGHLTLHGWVVDDPTAQVEYFDPRLRRFVVQNVRRDIQ